LASVEYPTSAYGFSFSTEKSDEVADANFAADESSPTLPVSNINTEDSLLEDQD
jgi:hypothetical protein